MYNEVVKQFLNCFTTEYITKQYSNHEKYIKINTTVGSHSFLFKL
jgi:hypothetical protein